MLKDFIIKQKLLYFLKLSFNLINLNLNLNLFLGVFSSLKLQINGKPQNRWRK